MPRALLRARTTVALLAFVAALLVLPASAAAAVGVVAPPALVSPTAGAATFAEGGSMTFEWSGVLQGDPAAVDRSFFRLEIADDADVPAGVQSPWIELERYEPTDAGVQATNLSVGVPVAGTYRWRVCAWGVVDAVSDNEIVQLPGGCSAARAFTTVVAAVAETTVGELKMETRVAVPGRVVKVIQRRAAPEPVTPPAPLPPAPVEEAPVVEAPPAQYQAVEAYDVTDRGSAVALESETTGLRTEDSGGGDAGVGGAIMGGLTSSLPLVPIPFWTLALVLACLPMAQLWRRDVLRMFDWPDGSINGSGGFDEVLDDLAIVQRDRHLKGSSTTADGDASAPVPAHSAPDRGRHAA